MGCGGSFSLLFEAWHFAYYLYFGQQKNWYINPNFTHKKKSSHSQLFLQSNHKRNKHINLTSSFQLSFSSWTKPNKKLGLSYDKLTLSYARQGSIKHRDRGIHDPKEGLKIEDCWVKKMFSPKWLIYVLPITLVTHTQTDNSQLTIRADPST